MFICVIASKTVGTALYLGDDYRHEFVTKLKFTNEEYWRG
jgi:hypothetical protein